MTKKHQLGRLEKVDLREVWANEARDFTPWLAREENIALLSEAIGMELEVEESEKSVGSFAADIVCLESGTEHRVLIENQLEKTDHAHLGQLITYAAGLDAVTVIWISGRFTDEHRAALDWFNNITQTDINFFGIEIELLRRVGDSVICPQFDIVVKPNQWTKTSRRASKLGQQQLEYWTAFCNLVEQKKGLVKPSKPKDSSWIRHTIFSGFNLDIGTAKRRIHINVFLSDDNRSTIFNLLEQEKNEIEREIGMELEWKRSSNRIYLRKFDCDTSDRKAWPEQHDWLYEKLQLFHSAFATRIKTLREEPQASPPSSILLEYWTAFHDLFKDRDGLVEPAKPRDHSYLTHSMGRSGFSLDTAASRKRNSIHVNINITGRNSKTYFDRLEADKEKIELESGEEFIWRRMPNNKSSQIVIRKSGCDIYDKDSWAEQHEWLYEKLQVFHRVFTERIKNL